jgi:hypothetical protein
MIYLIFTAEGFDEAKDIIKQNKASLWVNDNVLSDSQKEELAAAKISVTILPNNADPKNEKSVLAAIQYVEQQSPNTEILVEFL